MIISILLVRLKAETSEGCTTLPEFQFLLVRLKVKLASIRRGCCISPSGTIKRSIRYSPFNRDMISILLVRLKADNMSIEELYERHFNSFGTIKREFTVLYLHVFNVFQFLLVRLKDNFVLILSNVSHFNSFWYD